MSDNLNPLVSVIIPNYNHGIYLQQRILSVLDQTWQNFELIVLDDCSTDNSKSVIEQYRNHPKVSKIIYNEKNSGSTFKQWNKGIDAALGEYIWIAESDDYADPEFLNKAIAQLNEPEVSLVFVQSYRVNETGEIIDDCINWYSNEFKLPFLVNGIDFIKKYLFEKNSIYNASAVLFKKSTYPKHDKTIENFKFMGDWFIWIKIAETGKVAYIPDRLNYFRYHQTSVTIKYNKTIVNLIEDYQLLKYLKNHKLIANNKAYIQKLNFFAGRWLYCHKISLSNNLKLFKNAWALDKLIFARLTALWLTKKQSTIHE